MSDVILKSQFAQVNLINTFMVVSRFFSGIKQHCTLLTVVWQTGLKVNRKIIGLCLRPLTNNILYIYTHLLQ